MRLRHAQLYRGVPRTRDPIKPGLSHKAAGDPLLANLGTLGVVGPQPWVPTSSELRFAYELGCDAGADSAVRKVLA
ncbi:MAG: hypothetical protein WAL38_21630, partial [Solirubrobacteraceae bacterium]